MKLHILGICGTFMGGVAALARELGHAVEGSDQNVYPPMSTQLEALGIALASGYRPEHIGADVDQVVVGNALSRGNPAVEAVLDDGRDYRSGAQWLAERVLRGRRVLAVAGTHGKTTTSSLLAYLLDCAEAAPGFLIGGVPENFGVSARIGAPGAHRARARPADRQRRGSSTCRGAGDGLLDAGDALRHRRRRRLAGAPLEARRQRLRGGAGRRTT